MEEENIIKTRDGEEKRGRKGGKEEMSRGKKKRSAVRFKEN